MQLMLSILIAAFAELFQMLYIITGPKHHAVASYVGEPRIGESCMGRVSTYGRMRQVWQ